MSRSSRTARPAVVVGIAAAGIVISGAGVYAVLSATAFNETPQATSSGVLSLRLADNGGGFTTPLNDLAPGDTVHRYVKLSNDGDLDGRNLRLAVTDGSPSALSTDAARGLQVEVSACTVAWTPSTGACGGTASPVLTSRPLATLGTAVLDSGTFTAGTDRHLRVTVRLPDSTEVTQNGVRPAGSVQGLSAALTWTFTEDQRLGTTSSS